VESLRAHAHRCVTVGPGRRVRRDARGRLELEERAPARFSDDQVEADLAGLQGVSALGGTAIRWKVLPGRALPNRREGREFFDADKVGRRIVLRHWQRGDRFQPTGMPHAVKLQDWFTNRKVPKQRRHDLVVAVAESGQIFWVEGQRITEQFKVTGQTRRRLRWEWRRT
jgi:tRNA(Ile)-lysidine synthetase-like protein